MDNNFNFNLINKKTVLKKNYNISEKQNYNISDRALKNYKLKIYLLPYTFLKNSYNSVIPLTIYQTWYTKDLPPKMHETVELLKKQNPEFEHFLYDDDDCRKFIKENFDKYVLNAYDSLIPGAYKADLWRLCILYIKGGIYMDIKLNCVNGFKLLELTEDEHFALDRISHFTTPKPIFNALLVCKKENPLLLLGIKKIVDNVKKKYYGPNALYPTGPGMLSEVLLRNNLNINIDLLHYEDTKYLIYKNRFVISLVYPEYTQERKTHYAYYYHNKNIYK
jgi:mannosyltransferase OCH1-like enzyme